MGHSSSSSQPLRSEAYTLDHMELLQHLNNNVAEILLDDSGYDQVLIEELFRNALMLPYLLDQLLAISALHLATLPSQRSREAERFCQAVQLRDRARAAFDAVNPDEVHSLYIALFHSLSGLHSLCETLSHGDHFSAFLDRFVHFVWSQKKCRHQIQQSSDLGDSPFAPQYRVIIEAASEVAQNHSGRDYDELSNRLETTGLDPMALEACRSAVGHLQWVSDMRQHLPEHPSSLIHLILAWPALISESFIQLIEQRRPEGLIILAHYAAMLACSGFWVFASSGEALERLIARHLGSFWADWL